MSDSFTGSAWERALQKLRFDTQDMPGKQSFRNVPSQAEPVTESDTTLLEHNQTAMRQKRSLFQIVILLFILTAWSSSRLPAQDPLFADPDEPVAQEPDTSTHAAPAQAIQPLANSVPTPDRPGQSSAASEPSPATSTASTTATVPMLVRICRVLVWPLGLLTAWLVGALAVWSIGLLSAPLWVRRCYEVLNRKTIASLRFKDGKPVTLAHLTLVKAFSSHPRIADGWIDRHAAAICGWHSLNFESAARPGESLAAGTQTQAAVTEPDAAADFRIGKHAVHAAVSPETAELRPALPSGSICLLVESDSRRWDAGVLNVLLHAAMHPSSRLRLREHRVIPVVIDARCVERLKSNDQAAPRVAPTVFRVLKEELRRVPSLAEAVTDDWLRLLSGTDRILLVVENWQQTDAVLRKAILREHAAGHLPNMAVFSGGADLTALQKHGHPVRVTSLDHNTTSAASPVTAPSHAASTDVSGQTVTASTTATADSAAGTATVATGPVLEVTDTIGHEPVDPSVGTRLAASTTTPRAADVPTDSTRICITDDATPAAEPSAPTATSSRVSTATVVSQLGDAVNAAVPQLTQALLSRDELTRRRSAATLSDMLLNTLPALTESLDDEDVSIRRNVMSTLARIETLLKPAVTSCVDDTDAEVRRSAAMAIAQIDDDAVAPLMRALEDNIPDVRRAAAMALGRLGPMACDAVTGLTGLLEDSCGDCRHEAAVALGRIGPAASEAATALGHAVIEDNRHVRSAACRSLGSIGAADADIIAALCEAIQDPEAHVRRNAAWSLGELGTDWPEAVPALKGALRDEYAEVRQTACESLGELGPQARSAVDELGRLMSDSDVLVRRTIARSLARIDLAAVPVLSRALEDSDPEVRRLAAAALSGIGLAAVPALLHRQEATITNIEQPAADDPTMAETLEQLQSESTAAREKAVSILGGYGVAALPHLTTLLADESVEVRRRAVASIARAGASCSAAVDALTVALGDADVLVRREAVSSLGRIEASGSPVAVSTLARTLTDPDRETRCRAASALAAIAPESRSALPQLQRALHDLEPDVRWRAAVAIGAIGPAARSAVPALVGTLRDDDSDVRSRSAQALAQIGAAAVPSLIEALMDPDAEVRRCAAEALDRLGAIARDAVSPLCAALRDEDVVVRRSAASTLGRIGETATDAVQPLAQALSDTDPDVRRNAAVALSRMGGAAAEAIPVLQRATRDRVEKVRQAAAVALSRLNPGPTRHVA